MKEDNIIFKPAEESEIMIIQELAHTIWHNHYPGIITEEQINYMLDLMYSANVIKKEMTNGHQWILILEGDIPIGYISWFYEKKLRKVKLSKLYVLITYHGKGIGQKALEYVKSNAVKLKAGELYLTVNKTNHKAIEAYKRAGFSIEKSICTDIGNGFVMDDYVMSISL